jgi:hypothetical protein
VKSAVKGHHFESTEDVQKVVMQALKGIPHDVFQECYKQWQDRWKRCVQAEGKYFESDHIVVEE